MSTIKLTVDQWKLIRSQLQEEYPKTVFMLRNKMKRVLGFTVREHNSLVKGEDHGYYELQIHLDFYSERKYTMFLMKFSEHIKDRL